MTFNKTQTYSRRSWAVGALCMALALTMVMPTAVFARDDLLDPDYDNDLPEIVPGGGGTSGGGASSGGTSGGGSTSGGGGTTSGGGSSHSGGSASGGGTSHSGGSSSGGGSASRPPAPSRSAVGATNAASEPAASEEPDTEAPDAPIIEAYEPAGFVMRGTAEPHARVCVRTLDESGAVIEIASTEVLEDGSWELTIPLEFDAKISEVEVVCIDKAGNESELADATDVLVSILAEKDSVVLGASPVMLESDDESADYNDAVMVGLGVVLGGTAVSLLFVISNALAKRREKKLEQQAYDVALQAVTEELESQEAPAHFADTSLDEMDDLD